MLPLLLLPMLPLLPLLLLLVLLLTAGASAQMLRLGQCPDLHSVSNFDFTAYQGRWYENRRFKFLFETGQKCVTAEYQNLGGGVFYVENTGVGPLGVPKIRTQGYARLSGDSPCKGDLAVGYPEPPNETNYQVLDVEYDRYAFVYSCTNVRKKKFMHTEVLWVLTRNRRISTSMQMELMTKLTRMGFNWFKLMPTGQRFCPRRPALPTPLKPPGYKPPVDP